MWCESRLDVWIEQPLQEEQIHVKCAIYANRVFGSFYFENAVRKENYLEMLKTFLWPKLLRTPDYQKYFSQQDGASFHTSDIVQE